MNEPLKLIHPTDEATYRRIYAAAIEGYTGGTTKGDQVSGGMSAFDECVAIILPLLQKQIAALSQRPADPAWISALTGPETDEEWEQHAVAGNSLVHGIDRISFRNILKARAEALASPVPKEHE